MPTIARSFVACALAGTGALSGADAQSSRGALARGTFAITNVAVVPMTSDTVLTGVTVIVRDGRIASVGPGGGNELPRGARRIDGRGKYLIPGLADMHTHLYSDEAVPDSVAPHELGVMVATGVTVARLMIGTPEHLALRRDVADGRIAGPSSGSPVRSSPARKAATHASSPPLRMPAPRCGRFSAPATISSS